MFSNSKSKTVPFNKFKKLPKEQLQEAYSKGPLKHRERRIYLRQELNSLVKLFSDQPALLGPKFQLILCAFELTKEELFWYFRHIKASAPKGVKKGNEDDFKDNRISELIYLLDQLLFLVQTNRNGNQKKKKTIITLLNSFTNFLLFLKVIKEYYAEYLRTTHYKHLTNICNSTNYFTSVGGPSHPISKITTTIIEEIKVANMNSDFKILRLNYLRAESILSSVQSPAPLVKIRDAIERLTLIYQHTRFVDDLDSLIDSYASLKSLYFFKESFFDVKTILTAKKKNLILYYSFF